MKEKHTIIKLKEKGHSNRKVEKMTGIHRKTVAKYWDRHLAQTAALGEAWDSAGDARGLQEAIASEPSYYSGSRGPRKHNDRIDRLLDEILEGEAEKAAALGGSHKQKLTNIQIHRMVRDAGHDIGITVLSGHIREKRGKAKEEYTTPLATRRAQTQPTGTRSATAGESDGR